jgi:hypothetical protein
MLRRKKPSLIAIACAFSCVAGCSLFVDLDGLNDPDAGANTDAGSETDASSDVNLMGPTNDAAGDGAVFSGDAGAWAFVSSDGRTVVPPDAGLALPSNTVTSSAKVERGDLVVIGCDTGNNGGTITFDGFDTSALGLSVVGPQSDGLAYEAEIGWGVAQSSIGDLSITATVQNPSNDGFMDCTINVYRGGGPNVTLVATQKTSAGNGSGNATCGPIQTAPGGLAYYISARTFCIGEPYNPAFKQRQPINGNPNGDVVPTDGGIVQSEMMPCGGSTGSWICLMMTLSP